MKRDYEEEAMIFCNAIKDLAARQEALENLESYLSMHFKSWLEKYASTPADAADELERFARIF